MRITLTRTKLLMYGGLLLIVVALPLTVWMVRQQQNLQQEASGAPTLNLLPASVSDASVGDDIDLTLELRPGQNRTIKKVKFVIQYDTEKLNAKGFTNQSGLEMTGFGDVDGRMEVTLETDDATKFIKERKDLGTLGFTAMSETDEGSTNVRILANESQVVGVKNQFVPSANGSEVVIGEGEKICPADGKGECSWDVTPNTTSYTVKVTEEGSGTVVADEEGWTETRIEFDAKPGETYKCEVFAVNECGNGIPSEDSATCITPTPTPTVTLTPTLTPTATPTSTPTPTPTVTATPTPTVTPTPTTVITGTPTPTTIVQITPTTPPQGKGGVVTPQPTLPPTGTSEVLTIGAFVGTVLVILGGIFFFIL